MKIIITESQYRLLLSEQTVYTDKAAYDKALKIYNTVFGLYNALSTLYNTLQNEKWDTPPDWKSWKENLEAEPHKYEREIIALVPNKTERNNLVKNMYGKRYIVAFCGFKGKWETKQYMTKGNENADTPGLLEKICPSYSTGLYGYGYHKPNEPKMAKPIYQPTKPTTPVTPKPPTQPQTQIDNTKPFYFYVGNAVLQALTYDIAQKFANRLGIQNISSNVIRTNLNDYYVTEDGKIFASREEYNKDPNKPGIINYSAMGLQRV